jgi:outer membrane protein OmpA-like peptidoglycan-associated protein
MYVHTGSLSRFGVAVGAGDTFPIPYSKILWVGPAVHYLDVVQSSDPSTNSNDAHVLMAGLSVEAVFPAKAQPPAAADSDGDGILDRDDRCPTLPGPADNGGCPDLDSDGDTVVDRLDACPKVPGPVANHGCPLPDRDNDGLTDDVDRCPDEPGPRDFQGCPDRDKDGTPDVDDHCPDVPGPKENSGCPVYKLVTVTANKITISQKIFFAFNSSKVLPKSLPLLAEVAQALKDHATLKVRVEGHTDSVGNAAYNLKLSQNRAAAVRQILVENGVDAARLEAVGFGQTQPLDTNATVAGREVNRRVDFVITAGQPKADIRPGAPPAGPATSATAPPAPVTK